MGNRSSVACRAADPAKPDWMKYHLADRAFYPQDSGGGSRLLTQRHDNVLLKKELGRPDARVPWMLRYRTAALNHPQQQQWIGAMYVFAAHTHRHIAHTHTHTQA